MNVSIGVSPETFQHTMFGLSLISDGRRFRMVSCLPFQQDVSRYDVSVIVLRARSNRLSDLRMLVKPLLAAIPSAPRRKTTWVGNES